MEKILKMKQKEIEDYYCTRKKEEIFFSYVHTKEIHIELLFINVNHSSENR